jgi:hypothetical protein
MRKLVIFALLAGCGGSKPPPAKSVPAPTASSRPLTPSAEIPPVIRPLLPKHGIYVAGGGLVSSPWRVIVDSDSKTIYGGSAKQPGAPSYGKMDVEATKPLAVSDQTRLAQLADAAWREPPPDHPPHPTADYDEVLIVIDGDQMFFLEGYGPIRQPLAAKAIAELRAAAGM